MRNLKVVISECLMAGPLDQVVQRVEIAIKDYLSDRALFALKDMSDLEQQKYGQLLKIFIDTL